MNLNNCHNQVMVRRQNRFKRTFFKALILSLALALGLLALTACLGQNVAEPGLTRPPTDRAEEEIPVIRQDRVMSEEEAELFARRLNSPLENYDLVRPGGARNLGDLEKVRIERVVDGDTLIVLRQDQPVRLRLIGIDAPESYSHHQEDKRTHEGESVSRIAAAWLTDREIWLEFDQDPYDPYDRLLAYAWLDAHTMVNEVLAREGLVRVKRYPPNTFWHDHLEKLEKTAREEGRGIWGIGGNSSWGLSWKAGDEGRETTMNRKTIYLAGGCFWGVERYYQLLDQGIIETESGYANGHIEDPTYGQVVTGATGFAETVRLVYDGDVLSLDQVLAHFFRMINPTTRDRQGNDIGTQYRPGVYYTDEEDFGVICDYIDSRRKDYKDPIIVEVLPLENFYPAEDYHQDYLVKNPGGYCHVDLSLAEIPLGPSDLPSGIEEPVRPQGTVDAGIYESHLTGKSVRASFVLPKEEVLRKELSDLSYRVTREDETERPFTNEFDNHFEDGLYVDIVSGEPLFSSRDKYDAGCGWPAFSRPVAKGALIYKDDTSLWRRRTEVRSGGADSHLGHVFEDGPPEEGGFRYCINSAALRFVPLERMEKEGYGDWIGEVTSPRS